MIGRRPWHHRAMRTLRRWAPIGLGVVVVGLSAVGYGLLAPRIADSTRDQRGTLAIPPPGTARALFLDDGRPVYVVADDDGTPVVLDAQGGHVPSGAGHLVAWCPATQFFEDLFSGGAYTADGRRIDGPSPSGLLRYGVEAVPERPDLLAVTTTTQRLGDAGDTADPSSVPHTCPDAWLVHQPDPDEIFDPSVAAAQEPEDWVWLEGTLTDTGAAMLRLCDASAIDCASGAATGIDPAYLAAGGLEVPNLLIGRVRDGAIEGLIRVPELER